MGVVVRAGAATLPRLVAAVGRRPAGERDDQPRRRLDGEAAAGQGGGGEGAGARRARRPPPGLRVREGDARGQRPRLAGQRLGPRLRGQPGRVAVAEARYARRRHGSAEDALELSRSSAPELGAPEDVSPYGASLIRPPAAGVRAQGRGREEDGGSRGGGEGTCMQHATGLLRSGVAGALRGAARPAVAPRPAPTALSRWLGHPPHPERGRTPVTGSPSTPGS